jgi:flagellar biosynthesis protein FlhG
MMPDNIIAIASGKGGVGKTWLAVSLAHLVARSGRRILLFDGDVGLANIDVQLGLTPDKDLSMVFTGKAQIKDVITHYTTGFDIIAGRSGTLDFTALDSLKLEAIRKDLLALSKSYDMVIIDVGAGVEEYARYFTSIASRTLVVITDEPTSLTDAYAFIKLCLVSSNASQVEVVVNQAQSQKEGQETFGSLYKACTSFLKIAPVLLGIIRKDNKVRDTIRAQKSLIISSPNSTAATDAATISIKLMQKEKRVA